jgi:hypothetical protein
MARILCVILLIFFLDLLCLLNTCTTFRLFLNKISVGGQPLLFPQKKKKKKTATKNREQGAGSKALTKNHLWVLEAPKKCLVVYCWCLNENSCSGTEVLVLPWTERLPWEVYRLMAHPWGHHFGSYCMLHGTQFFFSSPSSMPHSLPAWCVCYVACMRRRRMQCWTPVPAPARVQRGRCKLHAAETHLKRCSRYISRA